MRVLSGDNLIHPDRDHTKGDYPAAGTVARQVYDLLFEQKGRPVDLSAAPFGSSQRHNALNCLRDFYGCDIRRTRSHTYILAGEWFGAHYSDYVNQAIDEAVARQRGAA